MSYPSDDLAPLFAPAPAGGVGYRQGIVRAWNSTTAENTIEVDGVLFNNLPILNTGESLLLAPDDVVGILTTGRAAGSWAILGRLTIPGTPAAASALRMIATAADTTQFVGTTTSLDFTDVDEHGPQVTVTVGGTGRLLIMVTTSFDYNGTDSEGGGFMSYDLSGPTPYAASERTSAKSLFSVSDTSADQVTWIMGTRQTATSLREGLAPGTYTVTAKYKTLNGDQVGFFDRDLVVIPL